MTDDTALPTADDLDSPQTVKLNDVLQLGNRWYYVRKLTKRDVIIRPIRKDQLHRIKTRTP